MAETNALSAEELQKQKADLDAREKALAEREAKLAAPKAQPEKDSALMTEAKRAYGIKPEHVHSQRDEGKYVVIVTKGGKKVSYAAGDTVKKLTQVQLDGVAPAKPADDAQ